MTLETVTVGILPSDLHKYLRAVDARGLAFGLGATNLSRDNVLTFHLHVDCGDDGTVVKLHPDGTWTATTEIVIGEQE